jgi:outer membrane protein TolC
MGEDRLARTALALLLTTWPAYALAQSASPSDRADVGSGGEGRQILVPSTMAQPSSRPGSASAQVGLPAPASQRQPIAPISLGLKHSVAAPLSELPPDGRIDLRTAIDLAVRHNLNVLLANERSEEARGAVREARARLLPNLSASIVQENVTVNLAAQGFTFAFLPDIPSTRLGPFNRFDARARLVQSLFDLRSIRDYAAEKNEVRATELEAALARQQVAAGTALAYLDAVAAARAVESANENLRLADELLTLARDQRDAGIATGLDVSRAETRVAEERVRVARARSDADNAIITLARVAGIPLEATITLVEPLGFVPEALPPLDTVLAEAARSRYEVRIAEELQRVLRNRRRAAEAERYPSVDVAADYGLSGNTPTTNDLATRSYGIRVNVPIFNGGATEGRISAARAREREAELQLGDVRGQVEEDVRAAILDVQSAAAEVQAANDQFRFAEQELTMSRDRFAAGVTSNIEVVEAQTALANARQAQVDALARYTAARIGLAAARGLIEQFRW